MNSNQDKSSAERVKDIIDGVPLFIRFILIVKIILFILNLLTNYISFYFSNLPQFWRLITTSFITTNLINMLIGFLIWIKDAISLEKSLGTIRYILIFITNSININLMYCLFMFIVDHFSKNKTLLRNEPLVISMSHKSKILSNIYYNYIVFD